jgi:hypothetical protein
MNGLYSLLLFLFIFGIFAGIFNGLNAFPDNKFPDAGYKIDNTTVTELQSAGTSQTTSDFSIWNLIQIFMTSLGSGITALFLVGYVIYGIMLGIGADPGFSLAISGGIQAIVTFITLWGLYELWTGRSVT